MAERSLNLPETPPKRRTDRLQGVGDGKIRKGGSIEHKFLNVFISEDADSVGEYLVWKVIVPAIQGMLRDAGHGIVDTVFGTGNNNRTNYSRGSYERRSYDSHKSASYRYDDRSRDDYDDRYARSYRSNSHHDSGDTEVIFRSRAKAEECRELLAEIIDRQRFATVSQLGDLIEIDNRDRRPDDDEWGWYSVARSKVRGTRDGYVLQLPKPEAIDERDLRR